MLNIDINGPWPPTTEEISRERERLNFVSKAREAVGVFIINDLSAPTIGNRVVTGILVTTGHLSLFKKRPVRFLDVLGLSAVASVPFMFLATGFMAAYIFGIGDSYRMSCGALIFGCLTVVIICLAYIALRYEMGGCSSETD